MDAAFETTDLDLAEDVLRSGYGGNLRLESHGAAGGIRLEQVPLTPAVRFDHHWFGISFTGGANPFGIVPITHVRSGRVVYQSDGSERRYAPGDVGLCVQAEHSSTVRGADLDVELVVIDPVLLSQIARTAPSRAEPPVRFTGYTPISRQAAQQWTNTCAYIRDNVLTGAQTGIQPLLATSAARLLAATALGVFPSNVLTDPTIEDRHDAHPDTLRRAISFIDDNAHADISAADIAAAAHVTIRAVQLAFRRHLDTTPMAYLRQARLQHAHQQLISADPATTTVTAVATRWGFASSSRFAACYRRAYGTSPSRTLRDS